MESDKSWNLTFYHQPCDECSIVCRARGLCWVTRSRSFIAGSGVQLELYNTWMRTVHGRVLAGGLSLGEAIMCGACALFFRTQMLRVCGQRRVEVHEVRSAE